MVFHLPPTGTDSKKFELMDSTLALSVEVNTTPENNKKSNENCELLIFDVSKQGTVNE